MTERKKKGIVSGLIILALLLCMGLYAYRKASGKDYFASATVGCAGESYYEKDDVGCLTVSLDTPDSQAGTWRTKAFQISDEALREKLSSADVKEIIGISVSCHIPWRQIQKSHLAPWKEDAMNLLLYTDTFDTFLTVTDIYTSDAP